MPHWDTNRSHRGLVDELDELEIAEWRRIDAEASRKRARQRQFEVAHWAYSIAEASSRGSEWPVQGRWTACPTPQSCGLARACLRAWARRLAVAYARNAVAHMRRTWSAEYPPG